MISCKPARNFERFSSLRTMYYKLKSSLPVTSLCPFCQVLLVYVSLWWLLSASVCCLFFLSFFSCLVCLPFFLVCVSFFLSSFRPLGLVLSVCCCLDLSLSLCAFSTSLSACLCTSFSVPPCLSSAAVCPLTLCLSCSSFPD